MCILLSTCLNTGKWKSIECNNNLWHLSRLDDNTNICSNMSCLACLTPCCTILHNVSPFCTTLCHVAPYCTILHHDAPRCTTLHHVAPCYAMLHHVAPWTTKLQDHVLPYCIMLHHAPCRAMLREENKGRLYNLKNIHVYIGHLWKGWTLELLWS